MNEWELQDAPKGTQRWWESSERDGQLAWDNLQYRWLNHETGERQPAMVDREGRLLPPIVAFELSDDRTEARAVVEFCWAPRRDG